VKRANLLLGDIGETARLAQRRQLASASIVPFRPVKFMLASPEETAADIWERMKSRTVVSRDSESTARVDQDRDRRDACPTRVWLEDKYDGIRCQVHKVAESVALY